MQNPQANWQFKNLDHRRNWKGAKQIVKHEWREFLKATDSSISLHKSDNFCSKIVVDYEVVDIHFYSFATVYQSRVTQLSLCNFQLLQRQLFGVVMKIVFLSGSPFTCWVSYESHRSLLQLGSICSLALSVTHIHHYIFGIEDTLSDVLS